MKKNKVVSILLQKALLFSVAVLFFGNAHVYAAGGFFDENFWKAAGVESIQKAVAQGADPKDKAVDGSTALMFAAKYNGDARILRSLMEDYAVDANAVNANGDSALSLLTTANPSLEAVQLLLAKGANNDVEQVIAAYNNAVNNGASPEIIELLLDNSEAGSLNEHSASMENAPTPIVVPAPQSTQLLGDAGSNPFLAHEFWQTATVEHIHKLLAQGHDINTRDAKGNSPLMLASSLNKDAQVIEALLAKGAKVHDKDKQDWNALMHAAASNGHPEVIEALLNHGADVNARDKAEWTPLMAAITLNPNKEIIDSLLARGAQVNAQEIEGRTALMLGAVNNQTTESINKLLNNGADLSTKDKNNKSALDYAKENTALSKTGIIHRLQ